MEASEPATSRREECGADGALRLVCVVGYGRSGSTVFERALAAAVGGFRLGEMRHVWERGVVNGELCECGEPFPRCPFWSAVCRRLGPPGDPRELLRLKAQVDRIRYVPFLAGDLPMPAGYRHRHDAWGRIVRALYGAIAEVSGSRLLVDSSKDPSYAYLLRSLFGPRVAFVHLVRRLPAVVHSWSRPKRRPEIHWAEARMPRFSPLRATAEWTVMNLLAARLVRLHAPASVVVRYEDLVADPRGTVFAVAARLGLPRRGEVWRDARTFDCGPGHTVSGNPVRFEPSLVTVRPDERWKSRARAPGYRLLALWEDLIGRAWSSGPCAVDGEGRP